MHKNRLFSVFAGAAALATVINGCSSSDGGIDGTPAPLAGAPAISFGGATTSTGHGGASTSANQGGKTGSTGGGSTSLPCYRYRKSMSILDVDFAGGWTGNNVLRFALVDRRGNFKGGTAVGDAHYAVRGWVSKQRR